MKAIGPKDFSRDTDTQWRLPNVVADTNSALGYLDECARGEDELTPIGYEENALRVRACRDLLIESAQALRMAVMVLRADLEGIISSNVAWSPASLGRGDDAPRLRAQMGCIREAFRAKDEDEKDDDWQELRDEIAPVLAAVRAAEDIVGAPHKSGEAWLDRVIAGEAGV
jgi:hypothetical protein